MVTRDWLLPPRSSNSGIHAPLPFGWLWRPLKNPGTLWQRWSVAEPLAVVLDGNVLDVLLADPSFLASLRAAQVSGRLVIEVPQVVRREAGLGEGAADRLRLASSLSPIARPDPVFVLDVTPLDTAPLASVTQAAEYESLQRGRVRDSEDALLAMLARQHGAVLVTDDGSGKKSGLLQRARANGVEAWAVDELRAWLLEDA